QHRQAEAIGDTCAQAIDQLAGEGGGQAISQHEHGIGERDVGARDAEALLHRQQEYRERLGDAAGQHVHDEGEDHQRNQERSLGRTSTPPQATGTLMAVIARRVRPVSGVMWRANTGSLCSSISSRSRTPLSATRPPTPLSLAASVARPPQVETQWPPLSMTMI